MSAINDIVRYIEEEEDNMRPARGIFGLTLFMVATYILAIVAWVLT